MFAHASLRSFFVIALLALGAAPVAACSPVLPPAARTSVAALVAIVPPPAAPSETAPAEAELARAKLVYPYNLPQYNDLAAEIAAASAAPESVGGKDANVGTP